MRPLRVAHLITMLELGGAQRLVLHNAAALDPAEFDCRVLAGPGGLLDDEARRTFGERFETCGALQREITPVADLRALADLAARLRRIAPDIVHTNSSKAGIVGRLAAVLAGVPIVVHTVHGWGFHPGQPRAVRQLFVLLERVAARATTRLVAVSAANARLGEAEGIAPLEAFEVIRPGVFGRRFREAAGNGRVRAELGIGDAPLVGMVACLKPQKTPGDFVRMAAQVAAAQPRAHFVLVGDGVLRGDVEAAVAASGLGPRFHLLGWRSDPEAVVGDLDVLVLSSLHEGLPMVVPEAMCAGKPVVATAVDGTPEAVVEGVTGFLVGHGQVERMAARVGLLLGDPALRARFGAAAAAASGAWEIDRMVAKHAELYRRLALSAGLRRNFPVAG